MNQLVSLVVVMLAAGATISSAQDIDCYICGSTILPSNSETRDVGCAAASVSNNNKTAGKQFRACSITYTTGSDGTTTISRSGSGAKYDKPFCASSGDTTACYCLTDGCNLQVLNVSRSLKCYECNSVDYFDNGCGDTVNTGSIYVHEVSGCSACGKTVSFSSGYTKRYSRGCARTINFDTECYSEDGISQCTCDTDLCNSATTFQRVTGMSVVLAIFSLLKCAY